MEMTLDEQKERAVKFIKALEWPEAETLASMVTDDFEFDPMGRLKQVPVLHGKAATKLMESTLRRAFPNRLKMTVLTVIAEANQVAIQAESEAITDKGRQYANRYHFYIRFAGDKIAQVREYNDTDHVRQVIFS
ncbi:nuclear transport factor 2 family protein [Candidatus Binatus sp.]|jgi:ketosteroid isomerase-like protein|uniref:nuclear transport factor 2 family protein n=1 Tax=Candidatus Binatus sp. TaxID=2811406 RepID=UPI003CB87210